ncbi:MAG: hypothetical protein Rubg2KO_04840 [Rubricoccaceae bacterium]
MARADVSGPNSSSESLPGCSSYGSIDFELSLRLDDPLGEGTIKVRVEIYNAETGALVDSRVARSDTSIPGTGGCHWVGHYDHLGDVADRVRFPSNTLLRIDFIPVQNAFHPSTSYYYFYCQGNPGDQIAGTTPFCPRGDTGPVPDVIFISDGGAIRTYPTPLGGGSSGRDVDDFFSGGWVLPYDLPTICASTGCDPENDASYVFLTPTPYSTSAPSGPITLSSSGTEDWIVPSSRSYDWEGSDVDEIVFSSGIDIEGALDINGTDFTFAVETGIEVNGVFDATNATLTSSGSYWEGIEYEPGSDGSLTNVNVLNAQPHLGGYSILIDGASPEFDDVTITPPQWANAGGGIRITGSQAAPTLHKVDVDQSTYHGVAIDNQADAHITDSDIDRARYRGLLAGYGTDTFLYPDDPYGTVGTQITFSGDEGVSASSSADVVFGYNYYPSQYWRPHVDGFNSVLDSGNEGLEATSSATIYAGSGGFTNSTHQRNRLYDNTGDDARASGSGSAVYAQCNWWNDTTPPFRTTATSGGYLDDSLWLEEDPYVNPSTPCVSPGGAPRTASARPSDRLSNAVAALGTPNDALVGFTSLIADEPDTPEAAAAMAQVSRLARRADDESARSGAEGVLSTYVSTAGPLRSIARRGLALVRHQRGDLNGSLDLLTALLTDADQKDDALYAYTARVYVLSDLGRKDEARAAYDDLLRIAPGSPQVDLAREHLGLPFEPETRERVAQATTEQEGVLAQVAMSPNPARGSTAFSFLITDSDAVHVRAAVYDMLGREVATVADAPFAPGAHTETVNVADLSPGLYVLRADVASEAGSTTFSETFTVIR